MCAVAQPRSPAARQGFWPAPVFSPYRITARREALSDADRPQGSPYLDRHVRAALERHVAEELLSNLAMDPEPRADEIARRAEAARAVLGQRVGGADQLARAAEAEGIDAS